MMSELEIASLTRAWLEREFLYMRPDFRLGNDDSLLKTGVIDSMGVLELVLFLEETFGVKVGDHQITADNLGSITAVARFVARARQAAA